jgi:hypothetical protein
MGYEADDRLRCRNYSKFVFFKLDPVGLLTSLQRIVSIINLEQSQHSP